MTMAYSGLTFTAQQIKLSLLQAADLRLDSCCPGTS